MSETNDLQLKDNTIDNLLFWTSSNKRAVMSFAMQWDIDLIYVAKILNGEVHDYQFLKQLLTMMVDCTVQMIHTINNNFADYHNLNQWSKRKITKNLMVKGWYINIEYYDNDLKLSFPGEPNDRNVDFTELLMLKLAGSPIKIAKLSLDKDKIALTHLARSYFYHKRSRLINKEDFDYLNENSKIIQNEMETYRKIMYFGFGLENVNINFED